MTTVQLGVMEIDVQDNGHLINFDDWSPEIAKAMAEADGLEFTECHWVAIEFMREFYKIYDIPPEVDPENWTGC